MTCLRQRAVHPYATQICLSPRGPHHPTLRVLRRRLDDYSAAGRAKDLARSQAELAELRRIDRAQLSSNARVDYDVVEYGLTNAIADDLAKAMKPRWMVVETNWKGRGGIRSIIRVEVGKAPKS